MGKELVGALKALEEKGISREIIVDAIEAALITAYKKNYDEANIRVDLNLDKGTMHLYSRREVVEKSEDDLLEMSLEDARQINPAYEIGDIVETEEVPRDCFQSARSQNPRSQCA